MTDARAKPPAMPRLSAAEAKTRFGALLDAAQRQPVAIEKHGRPVAVVMSAQDYDDYAALKLARLKAEIQAGLDAAAAGRIVDGEAAFVRARARLKG